MIGARSRSLTSLLLIGFTLLGCAGVPGKEEKSARSELRATGARLIGPEGRAVLPALRPDSPPADFVRYAVMNHPAVVAAYYDWRAKVEEITSAAARPDPQFTFQADITNTLTSFMPGLMFDLMGPGKRAAMAREASAGAGVARRAYVSAVLDAAAEAWRARIDLGFVDEAARLRAASIGALERSLAIANADYATGRGMGTLAEPVRIANDLARARSELAALGDRRAAVRARFKSALGLGPAEPDPAWPQAGLAPTAIPGEDELWRRAAAANPDLASMRAMVEMTLAGVEVARKTGTPDVAVGGMVDLRTNPLLIRPTATISLPLWRDKIAATVAAAKARHEAAAARVNAAQLTLAAEFAQRLYMVREADRMIAYIDREALPSFEQAIATAEAAYQSGLATPGMIPEVQLMALAMRRERLEALRDRETAVVELMMLTADVAPPGAPLPGTKPQA